MDEVTKEFIIESRENLDQLERDLVALEKDPSSPGTLAGIFRTMHSLKGTCGFLAFEKLEAIAHAAENLLSLLRDGKFAMSATIANALLATSDVIREMLANIEACGSEGVIDEEPIVTMLTRLQSSRQASLDRGIESIEKPVAAGGETGSVDSTVRVSVALLDQLMNMVGELVLTRNQIVQSSVRSENTCFAVASQRLNIITSELQERVMKTRMEPMTNVWGKFPRLVRDLAQACSKRVRLGIEGAHTELDRTLLDAIRDPLTHLVRNAIDHGIETPEVRVAAGKPAEGSLSLRAYHEGGLVNIEMADDGAGINAETVKRLAIERGLVTPEQAARMNEREAIDLIFVPGFSTAAKVSSISGRGVGMDVVKTHIERVGGIVDVLTEAGRGTTFKIRIPLTLAIIPALTVSCGGDRYAIPQVNVTELLRVERVGGLESVHGALVHRLRGNLLPVLHLGDELQVSTVRPDGNTVQIVVLQAGERRFGIIVEDVHDAGEIVVKPLGWLLKGTPCLAGATIMGDGTVALILDVFSLARRAELIAAEAHSHTTVEQAPKAPEDAREELLLFGVGERGMAMPLSAVARLEEFGRKDIERTGARNAVQYRGQILPLVSVAGALETSLADQSSDLIRAIIYTEHGRSVGLVVSHIQDIVHESTRFQRGTPQPGILGSAVIGSRVTDLLDVRAIIRADDPSFFDEVAQ